MLVVVGDDRAARDLAADLRSWLAPRRVRLYPSRGVAYESHLAPPPHLVGLRVAALDALLDETPATEDGPGGGQPVVVISAVALSEKVPDPTLRPRSFTLRVGELIDLDECAGALVDAGYERVEQVEERGSVRAAGRDPRHLPRHRGAGRAGRHLRRGDRVAAVVLDLHPALAGGGRGGRGGPRRRARDGAPRAGRDRSRHRRLPRRLGRGVRPRRHRRAAPAGPLRGAARPARRSLGGRDRGRGGARPGPHRPLERRLRRLRRAGRRASVRAPGADPLGAGGPQPHLAVGAVRRTVDRAACPGRRLGLPHARGSRAGARAPGALRLPHGRGVPPPRGRRARRLQPRAPESRLARGRRRGRRRGRPPGAGPGGRALLRGGLPARGLHRPAAEAGGVPRAAPAAPPPRRAAGDRRALPARSAAVVHRAADG